MNNFFRKTLLASAVTIALAAATSGAMAQTFPSFTVDESSVAGAIANTFTADKITGNYVEVISFAGAPASGTFDVALRWNAGQFVATDGTSPVKSQLGNFTLNTNQYGLYALYQGTGTYSSNGGQTTFNFTPGGSLSVFTDANSDTTFNQPSNGTTPFTTNNATDDKLIATGVPTFGQGKLDPSLTTCGSSGGAGINCGSFGATSTFALTSDGSKYFVAPAPFYNLSFQSGQLNNFSPTSTQVINGSLDVVFASNDVPEPGIVALFGLGLFGLAASRRKSANSKNA